MRDLYIVGFSLMAANLYYCLSFQCRRYLLMMVSGPWSRIYMRASGGQGGLRFIMHGRYGAPTFVPSQQLTARVIDHKSADQMWSGSISRMSPVQINTQSNSVTLPIPSRTRYQNETCIRFRISSKLGSFSAFTFPCRTKKSRRTNENSISISII